mmetsp:Transcript_11457/g.15781  ORF Transcript_11457/g.15781 Transcript_11457/m.15781 type:complete len:130 (-) Transcript_11457:2-391(-)
MMILPHVVVIQVNKSSSRLESLRFFDVVGDELVNRFKANYFLEDAVEGSVISVLNLKEFISRSLLGLRHNAIIHMSGKRLNGSAGYFINRHKLQGYVRNINAVVDVVPAVEHVFPDLVDDEEDEMGADI